MEQTFVSVFTVIVPFPDTVLLLGEVVLLTWKAYSHSYIAFRYFEKKVRDEKTNPVVVITNRLQNPIMYIVQQHPRTSFGPWACQFFNSNINNSLHFSFPNQLCVCVRKNIYFRLMVHIRSDWLTI